jgi:hypothetical protein
MADPNVFHIGSLLDLDYRVMPVGVDYATITIGPFRLPLAAVPLLKAVIDTAAIRAADNQSRMDPADHCVPLTAIPDH